MNKKQVFVLGTATGIIITIIIIIWFANQEKDADIEEIIIDPNEFEDFEQLSQNQKTEKIIQVSSEDMESIEKIEAKLPDEIKDKESLAKTISKIRNSITDSELQAGENIHIGDVNTIFKFEIYHQNGE